MDAIVLHPYAVPPEQLRRSIALLRAIPDATEMPIEITEWGTSSKEEAPAHLMKGYCQFALSAVTRFIWYPLGDRGDGFAPLIDGNNVTPVGRAYQMAQTAFWGEPVTDLGLDPFTYGCGFGDKAMVLWGALRQVTLTEGVRAFASDGQPLASEELVLDRDRPIVLLSDAPIRIGEELRLGPHGVIADSYDQFAFPAQGQTTGPLMILAEKGRNSVPFATRPGQECGGVPWSPYLGNELDMSLRASADWVLPGEVPGLQGPQPVAIVQRYRAERSSAARLWIDIAPSAESMDGVILRIRQGRDILLELWVAEATIVELPIALTAGMDTDVIVAPGENAHGDFTRLRIRFLEER
ncbi:hypothetical protein [Aliiruegeria lutimaris]|uniref:Uncharacterized protein n=1 Tax=Aliiruegeria lutimaris TaxID=571298 RepID=A0A1G9HTI7_9RHOB|nr:hypothetical protein [Aliiruegeria lutimaris]SDL16278.1 hypothetical protein SAMN04488026_107020 [Aliiruegeria lutimaris]